MARTDRTERSGAGGTPGKKSAKKASKKASKRASKQPAQQSANKASKKSANKSAKGSGNGTPMEHRVVYFRNPADAAESVTAMLEPYMVEGRASLLALDRPCRAALKTWSAARRDGHEILILNARWTAWKMRLRRVRSRSAMERHARSVLDRVGKPVAVVSMLGAALWTGGRRDQCLDYEAVWHDLAKQEGFPMLCLYPLDLMHEVGHTRTGDVRTQEDITNVHDGTGVPATPEPVGRPL